MLNKKLIISFLTTFALFSLFVSPAFAAAPDGAGPWADTVVSTTQGMQKDGNPISAIRSNPSSALGIAENNTTEGNFYSLGFGGVITLGFDNGISSGVILVEATNPGYPDEKARVEVSEDGVTWVNAGQVTTDGQVSIPDSTGCAKFVRITDQSDVNNFPDATADAYDVDGVQAQGEACTPVTPTPTPPQGGTCGCSTNITQKNKTNVNINVNSKANTGGNKANKNNGGNTTITTGNANSNTNITVAGGTNSVTGEGCCCDGDTNVTISGNGNGSTNTVNINSKKSKSNSSKKK